MSDQFWVFLGVAVTAVGGLVGAMKARDASRQRAAEERAEFWRVERDRVQKLVDDGLVREDRLRDELVESRRELVVLHQEFGEARKGRMVKERTAATMVLIDGAGVIVDMSENMPLLTGWSVTELIGESVAKLMPVRYRADHAIALANASSAGKRVIRGDGDVRGWLFLLHRDGHEVPVSISLIGGGTGKEARYTGIIRHRSGANSYY